MAARFVAATEGAAPLILQVESPSTTSLLRVYRFEASGNSSTGTASRPALYRPSSKGTGISNIAASLTSIATPTASAYASFSVNPTLPGLTTFSSNLPMRIEWIASHGAELIAAGTPVGVGCVVLYAGASGGHTWRGEINWEEE